MKEWASLLTTTDRISAQISVQAKLLIEIENCSHFFCHNAI